MNQKLRENKAHGTTGYPYCQYSVSNIRYGLHVPVHWHDEMELIFVDRGHLQVNVGGVDRELIPGQVLIVNPRQLHLMSTEDLSVSYHALLFPLELVSFQSADDLEQTVLKPLRTGQRRLPTLVPETVLTEENVALLHRVVQINNQKSPMYQLETRLLLLQFFMELLRRAPLEKADTDEAGKMQREMLEYIRMHYRSRISLEDLAQQFHLSPKYLSRYFKEHFHLTLSEYIGHLRMSHARDLLENTDLSVTEVAIESGFSGVSFFIRSFTEQNGCSPLKWRKRQEGLQ